MAAPSLGVRAGTMHIRVLPDTSVFPGKLRKDLTKAIKRIEDTLPELEVVVSKARVNNAKIRASIREKLAKLEDFDIDVKANVDVNLKSLSRTQEFIESAAKAMDPEVQMKVLTKLDEAYMRRITKRVEDAFTAIEVNLDESNVGARRYVDALEREFRHLSGKLRDEILSPADEAVLRHRINAVAEKLDDLAKDRTVHVDVNPFTAWAAARLAWLTRPRVVEIIANVSKTSLAKAATALAALSGARLSYDYLKRFSDWISEIDKKLPSLAFGALGVSTAFSGIMGAISGIVGIGDGLAATLPSLLLVPGLLTGAAMSGVALFVALKDSKEELAELGPSYTRLGQIIKKAFWTDARPAIIRFSNSIMPQLERSFDKTSAALGRFTADLADSFRGEFAGGRLEAMFDGLAKSWDILSTGTDAFAGAITNLGLVAARYMPRLSQWFVDLSVQFDNWLSDVSTDGRLDGWIEEAVDSFYALWDVVAATTGIFQGLWAAADEAGSGGLRGFADMLLGWEQAVNGSKWQETLTSMFRGAGDAMEGFASGLKRVGDMLHGLRDPIEYLLGESGMALGNFIGGLADSLNNPKVEQGIRDFIDGVSSGLESLESAMDPVADAFGELASFAGRLAEGVGPVLAEALETVAPLLEKVVDAITVSGLSDGLVELLEALAPSLDELASALAEDLPDLIDALVEALPALIPLLQFALELLTGFLELMPDKEGGAKPFEEMGTAAMVLYGIMALLTGGFSTIIDQVQFFAEKASEQIEDLKGVFDSVVSWISEFNSRIAIGLAVAISWFAQFPSRVQQVFATASTWLVSRGIEIMNGFRSGTESGFAVVITFLAGIPSRVGAFFAGAGSWLVASGAALLNGFAAGVERAVGEVVARISSAIAKVRSLFPNSPAKIGPFSGRGWVSYSGLAVGETFGDNIAASLEASRRRISRSMSGLRGEFTSLTSDVSSMSADFDSSARFSASAARSQRTSANIAALASGTAPVVAGTSVSATFVQPEQREQFREFAAVLQRELKK
ncbi:hypothetical protein MUN77_01620 [Leucobacter allii]|uniref:phage tail protein n=1 Tax=Leucobacter allii TaxID=2932247 RepID=UPI001FD31AFD|nr:hypothetical protein [Leucobacter allii]UOR02058.1 hypothetical protein MUN77_01620 [Leucobacter allii]